MQSQTGFQKTNTTFGKKCSVPGKKTYEEAVTGETKTTLTNDITIPGYSIVNLNRGVKSEFNKALTVSRSVAKRCIALY